MPALIMCTYVLARISVAWAQDPDERQRGSEERTDTHIVKLGSGQGLPPPQPG